MERLCLEHAPGPVAVVEHLAPSRTIWHSYRRRIKPAGRIGGPE